MTDYEMFSEYPFWERLGMTTLYKMVKDACPLVEKCHIIEAVERQENIFDLIKRVKREIE